MAATIQTIQKPTRARALDTSMSFQTVTQNLIDTNNTVYSRGSSQILLASATSGSETQLLGSGKFPSGGFKENFVRYSETELFHPTKRDATPNTADMLIDRGDGTMSRANGGSATINYNTGEINMVGCPPRSEFRIWATGCSALSGTMRTDAASSNCIEKISARSINPIANAKLTCIILS